MLGNIRKMNKGLLGVVTAFALAFIGLFLGNSVNAEEITYTMAKDSDFEWVSSKATSYERPGIKGRGYYRYKGNGVHVEIPTKIQGYDVGNFYRMFENNTTVKSVKTTAPSLINVSAMFRDFKGTELYLNDMNMSNVYNISEMFYSAVNLKTLHIDEWDTSKVRNAYNFLYGVKELTTIDITNWNLDSFDSNTDRMFQGATLDKLDLTGLRIPNTFNLSYMFNRAKIGELDISGLEIPKVTNLRGMFGEAVIGKLTLGEIDVSSVRYMDSMFKNSQIEDLRIPNWSTPLLESAEGMFSEIQDGSITFEGWEFPKTASLKNMFMNSKIDNLDTNSFIINKEVGMEGMFQGYKNSELDLSGWDFSFRPSTTMNNMFKDSLLWNVYVSEDTDVSRLEGITGLPSDLEFIQKEYVPTPPPTTEPETPGNNGSDGEEGNTGNEGDDINNGNASGDKNTVTANIVSGGLNLETANLLNFGLIELGKTKKTHYTTFTSPLQVKDLRGEQTGWTLSVEATPMKSETDTFPTGSLTLGSLTSVSGGTDGVVKELTEPTIIDDGGRTLVASATSGEGMGLTNLEFGEQALGLVVDPVTAKEGEYSSTITWIIEAVPVP